MAYLESNLKTELRDALRDAGCCCEKFPDNAKGVKKPYDLVAGIQGRLCAIETKLTKCGSEHHLARRKPDMIVVKLSDVRENQVIALNDTWAKGCWAFVGAGLYEQMTHARECWMVPWVLFKGREVWTLGDLQQLGPPHLIWARGRGWDVSPLVAWSDEEHQMLCSVDHAIRMTAE